MSALLPVNEAIAEILDSLAEIDCGSQWLALNDCLGQILAEDIISGINVPPEDNSAVDGYVITRELCRAEHAQRYPVIDRIAAGCDPAALPPDSVARIFTGASVPRGGAAVVMQEDCIAEGDQVTLPAGIKIGENIRPAGQDILENAVLLHKGTPLRPADLGLLASVGVATVKVKKPLKVAVFSTGDELVEPGSDAPAGKIFNSNRYTLTALLTGLAVEVVDLGIVADSFDATIAALKKAASVADFIISSGGASVGEEDYIKAAVQQLGQLKLWQLAIKPGKPLAYGSVLNTPFMGLPGNPTSVFVTFSLLAKPAIGKLQGRQDKPVRAIRLPAFFDITKSSQRQEYLRVRLSERDGVLGLESYPNQSSGVLASASWADGFAVIPVNSTVNHGDLVDYLCFAALGV